MRRVGRCVAVAGVFAACLLVLPSLGLAGAPRLAGAYVVPPTSDQIAQGAVPFPDCPPFAVISSRGSGEDPGTADWDQGLGPPGLNFATRLGSLLPGVEYSYNPPPGYPAQPSITLKNLILHFSEYWTVYQPSEDAGFEQLLQMVKNEVGACPRTRLILTGYSQGAEVTGDLYEDVELTSLGQAIFGVALFGDPRYNHLDPSDFVTALQQAQLGYTTDGIATSILFAGSPHSFDAGFGRVLSYCVAGDPVCMGAGYLLSWKSHSKYVSSGDAGDAADHLGSLVPQEQVAVSPSTGPPASTITFSGSGFAANQSLAIYLDNTLIGSASTDGTGAFLQLVTVPSGLAPGAHTFRAANWSGVGAAAFTVSKTTLKLNPTSGESGTAVSATGKNYAPGETIAISFDATSIATAVASSTGSFSKSFIVPANSGAGTHTITAVGQTSLLEANAGFTVNSGPGTPLWLNSLPTENSTPRPSKVAISHDGSKVFVTGTTNGGASFDDYVTLAFNPATGAQLWAATYNGTGNGNDEAEAVAVSPDGSKVFVTGVSEGAGETDYATVAYDAATGSQLWVTRYSGGTSNVADAIAVSPDGSKVFVSGTSNGGATSDDFATVAYDAASGNQLWAVRYNGGGPSDDEAFAIAVAPDGSTVFVTGTSEAGISYDYATIAYVAATGNVAWTAFYNGPGNGADEATAVAISPDGSKLFVTGQSAGAGSAGWDYATVAYGAAGGNQLWAARYDGGGGDDEAEGMAVSPDGSKVFVTGQSLGTDGNSDYATLAYSTSSGNQVWASRYSNGSGGDAATSVAVSPDGSELYVTGQSFGVSSNSDYATLAYGAVSGNQLWAVRYNGTGNGADIAQAIAVSTDGSKVFVTGQSAGADGKFDEVTIAYKSN